MSWLFNKEDNNEEADVTPDITEEREIVELMNEIADEAIKLASDIIDGSGDTRDKFNELVKTKEMTIPLALDDLMERVDKLVDKFAPILKADEHHVMVVRNAMKAKILIRLLERSDDILGRL